jgi:hypothetical protein
VHGILKQNAEKFVNSQCQKPSERCPENFPICDVKRELSQLVIYSSMNSRISDLFDSSFSEKCRRHAMWINFVFNKIHLFWTIDE